MTPRPNSPRRTSGSRTQTSYHQRTGHGRPAIGSSRSGAAARTPGRCRASRSARRSSMPSSTSASTKTRGNPRVAWSPIASASGLEAAPTVRTRTGEPKPAATSAVSSVHPLATTTTSSSPGAADDTSRSSRRPITRPSLHAGTTTLITGRARSSWLPALPAFPLGPVVGGQELGNLQLPAEHGGQALAADLPHAGAPLCVVDQLYDPLGQRSDIVTSGIKACLARRDPPLVQVELDDRLAERHVLHDLVHR